MIEHVQQLLHYLHINSTKTVGLCSNKKFGAVLHNSVRTVVLVRDIHMNSSCRVVHQLGNACYYSAQNLFSSSLLSKKLKIKIYRTIILPVVLYGCET